MSFPDTALPRAEVVGNPVRAELFSSPATSGAATAAPSCWCSAARSGPCPSTGRPSRPLARWRDRSDLAIHHVVGRRDWPTLERPTETGALAYEAVEYEDDMPAQLARADLVVCRGGSGTLFELAATGRPAIIVPSLVTTGGQQIANAERVAATGGAVVVPDDELDGDRLVAEVDALLADPGRLGRMSAQVRLARRARCRRPGRRPGRGARACPLIGPAGRSTSATPAASTSSTSAAPA